MSIPTGTRTFLAEIQPLGSISFRDARPFQAGEDAVARRLPFPPPPGVVWSALQEALDAPGRWLWMSGLALSDGRRGGDCFPAPADLRTIRTRDSEGRGPQRWTTVAPTRARPASSLHAPQDGLATLWPRSTRDVDRPDSAFLAGRSWRSYLLDDVSPMDIVSAPDLFQHDVRTGNQIEGRNAVSGRLYTREVTHLDLMRDIRFRTRVRLLPGVKPRKTRSPRPAQTLLRFGGEARIARITLVEGDDWCGGFDETLQSEVAARLAAQSEGVLRVKVVLLSPAVFSADVRYLAAYRRTAAWRPFWLRPGHWVEVPWLGDAQVRLVGAAVDRAFALGQWDPRSPSGTPSDRGGPRPLYRAVPAGAVYFVEVEPAVGQPRQDLLQRLFDRLWFGTLLVNRDGLPTAFGRAGFATTILGAWDHA